MHNTSVLTLKLAVLIKSNGVKIWHMTTICCIQKCTFITHSSVLLYNKYSNKKFILTGLFLFSTSQEK